MLYSCLIESIWSPLPIVKMFLQCHATVRRRTAGLRGKTRVLRLGLGQHIHIYIYIYIYVYIQRERLLYINIHMHIHMHKLCMCIYTCVYMCIYIYIHIMFRRLRVSGPSRDLANVTRTRSSTDSRPHLR